MEISAQKVKRYTGIPIKTLIISMSFFLGFLYCIFLSYPDQFFSPLSLIEELSTDTPFPSSSLVGVGYLPLDSLAYMSNGLEFSISDLSAYDSLWIVAGQYQNILLFYISKVAHQILPANPYVIVVIINHMFLLLALRNYLTVIKILNINAEKFLFWIAVNLILFYTLYSLNKEVIGMFMVSEFVLFTYKPNYLRVLLVLAVALFTRNVFFVFGALIVINNFVRLHPLAVFFIFAAIILPGILYFTGGAVLGDKFGQLDGATKNWGQQSAQITTYFYEYIKYPMGYLLNYIIVLAVNVLGAGLNPQYWVDYLTSFNLSQFLLQLSSLLFGLLILKNILRGSLTTLTFWNGPIKFFVYYTMITCVLPFSQHRYLLPIYPVLVLSYLYSCAHSPLRHNRSKFSDRP